jgi:predicted enzyme related to lactoylglutathione lyase
MGRVIHFELPIDDPERAVDFYQKAFGWKIEKWSGNEDYWLVATGENDEPGINGALTRRGTLKATTNTVAVESIEDAAARIAAAGGQVLGPKHAIPFVGYHQYCVDSEGNVFGILKEDGSAR